MTTSIRKALRDQHYSQIFTNISMKQFLTLFLFSITTTAVFAQNALDYYEKMNKGKAFALDNDLASAVDSYRQAFENFDFAFARDCYHAMELAIYANDSIHLDYFIKKSITLGIRTVDLEKSGKLNGYLKSDLYTEIKEAEDSLLVIYRSGVNWKLRAEIIEMFKDDQEIRDRYYNASFFKRIKIQKQWESLNSQQVERLIEITKQYGFPGESLIGLDRNQMHPKIRTTNFSAGMPIVLLIHHYSQPNQSFDNLLAEEVKKGNLYNEHFATICDFEAEFGKGKYENHGYYGLRHKPKKYDADALNKKREEIGILSFEQMDQLNTLDYLTKYWNRLY